MQLVMLVSAYDVAEHGCDSLTDNEFSLCRNRLLIFFNTQVFS